MNPIDLLHTIVNDEQISEEGAIQYIGLLGSGNDEVRELLGKYQTECVRVRDPEMARLMAKEKDVSYPVCCSRIMENEYYTGAESIETLLRDYGLFEKTEDYKVDIARKHYKKCFLLT